MAPILELDQISKRFGAVVVADAIGLRVLRGEALGIIGPNGAGKTTLFGMITGMVRPDAGRVLLEGDDITHLSPPRRCRRGVARSFQVPQPFGGMSVFENLLVAAQFGAGEPDPDPMRACVDLLYRCGRAPYAHPRPSPLTPAQPQR